MADDYAWDTDHFIVCNGTEETPMNFEGLNTWAQGQGGDPAAAITEIVTSGMYLLEADIEFGNSTDPTYFQSKNEMVYFADGKVFVVKSAATLELGDLQDSWAIDGSMWSFGPSTNMPVIVNGQTTAKVYLYSSKLHMRTAHDVVFVDGETDIKNTIMSAIFDGSALCYWKWDTPVKSLKLDKVYFTNVCAPIFNVTPDVFQDVHVHYAKYGIYSTVAMTVTGLLTTSVTVADVRNSGAVTMLIKNPKMNIATLLIQNAAGVVKEQYTCNVHVVDKDNVDLEGVTVACEDQFAAPVFSVETDANGDIAEQVITYKQWAGTDETLTEYSPHKFTLSKAGYKTLVIDEITVDHLLVWEVKLVDAGSFTNFTEDELMDHIMGIEGYASPTVYIGLSTADPGEGALGGACNEVPNAFDYARVLTTGDWNVSAGGVVTNANEIAFPAANGGPWGTISHYFLATSGVHGAGDILIYDQLDEAKAVVDGDIVKFAAETLSFTLD